MGGVTLFQPVPKSVREGRLVGGATACTGRRREKVLHNHPRKLAENSKGRSCPQSCAGQVLKAACGRETRIFFGPWQRSGTVDHRRRIRVERRTRSVFILWDEDTAAGAPGKSSSQQSSGGGEQEGGSKASDRAELRRRSSVSDHRLSNR
jgi:hypothetical protein